MKKRIKCITVLAIVSFIGACLQLESGQITQARAADQGYGHWRVNFGLVLEHRARITVANLSPGRAAEPLAFQCSVFDENGALVFQTPRLEVPSRGFRHQDIRFEDLAAVVGDPATLRKTVRLDVIVSGFQSSVSSSSPVVGSLDIIDPTGKTTVYESFGNLIFFVPVTGDFDG